MVDRGPVDGALDVVGGATAKAAFDAVRDGGRYATVVPEFWTPGGQFTPARDIDPAVVLVEPEGEHLAELSRLAGNGELSTRVARQFPMERAAEAHALLGSRGVRGKSSSRHLDLYQGRGMRLCDMNISGDTPSSADVDSITELVAAVDHTQRTEDADGFLALLRPDAVWVTGHGKRLYGLPTITEFAHRVLPGATADSYATYTPDHILFVRPDIAVVNVTQKYFLRASPEEPASIGSPVYFVSKVDGQWRIAAAQNTTVVPDN